MRCSQGTQQSIDLVVSRDTVLVPIQHTTCSHELQQLQQRVTVACSPGTPLCECFGLSPGRAGRPLDCGATALTRMHWLQYWHAFRSAGAWARWLGAGCSRMCTVVPAPPTPAQHPTPGCTPVHLPPVLNAPACLAYVLSLTSSNPLPPTLQPAPNSYPAPNMTPGRATSHCQPIQLIVTNERGLATGSAAAMLGNAWRQDAPVQQRRLLCHDDGPP
jgi:hypothetical protein